MFLYSLTTVLVFVLVAFNILVPVSESVERADLIRLVGFWWVSWLKADAIVVVIDASNEASYDSLFSNWMPSILKVSPSVGEDRIDNVQKPVLVVANKVDLIEEHEQNLKLEQVLNRVLSEYLVGSFYYQVMNRVLKFAWSALLRQLWIWIKFYTMQRNLWYFLLPLYMTEPLMYVLLTKLRIDASRTFKVYSSKDIPCFQS